MVTMQGRITIRRNAAATSKSCMGEVSFPQRAFEGSSDKIEHRSVISPGIFHEGVVPWNIRLAASPVRGSAVTKGIRIPVSARDYSAPDGLRRPQAASFFSNSSTRWPTVFIDSSSAV